MINSDIIVAANEAKITLDGGAGSKDTLTLNGTLDLSGVKSIKGFETIDATNAIISAEAANGLKAKFVNGSNLVVSGDAKATTSINLSGLSVDKNESATVALNGLTKETITLSKDKGITESIEIFNPDVKGNEQVSVTIKNFAKGDTADKLVVANGSYVVALDLVKADKIDPSKATQALKYIQENVTGLQAGTNYVAINTANGKASYIWKVDGATATRDNIKLVATVDKALATTDFIGGDTPVPSETVDTKDYPVTSGELDLSTVVMSDPNKSYAVELGTNPDVASITSVKLPAGVKAAALVIENKGTAPTGAVAVSVPADAAITTLTLGSATDNTQYNVTVAANAQISTIVTNNADNNIDISALPAGTVKVVEAGAGIDTLTIGGEAAADGFTMTGVEKLAYTGTTINSDAIFANAEPNKTLELINESGNANKKLIVKAGTANDGNVDLSSLVNTEVAGKAAAIEVTGVQSGKTVTLSSGTAAKAIVETVTLGTATNVTIVKAEKGDNIYSNSFAKAASGNFTEIDLSKDTITANQAVFAKAAVKDAAAAVTAATDAAKKLTTADAKAVLAINDEAGNGYVFAITGATTGGTQELIATTSGYKFSASDSIKNGTITISDVAPIPQPTSGELQAVLIDQTTDYELTVVNPPVSVDEAGTVLKLASDKVTALKAAGAKYLTVDATSEKAATLSFDAAVKNSSAIEIVDLQGTGTRTVDLKNVNATAVKNITDGAANTTLDISSKTFGSADADKFATGLKIDLGAGTDVVNIGNQTHTSGAFILTGVEGIKASGGTLDAALVTKTASGAVTTDLTQIEGSLTLKNFAGATSIDLSNIKTAVTNDTALTIDIVAATPVTSGDLTSVIGTVAKDTLVVSGDYTKLTTLDSIETLSLSGATTLKAATVSGKELTVNSGGATTLKIDASGASSVDLGNLLKGNAAVTVNLTNVKAANADITLSAKDQFVETVEVSANDLNATENIILTNYQSATDKIKIASGAIAGSSGNVTEAQLESKIGNISHVKAENGVLVLEKSSNTKVDAADATLANALSVLNNGTKATSTKIFEANDVVLFRDEAANKSYLIGIGALSNTNDDIVVELVGATSLTSLAGDSSNGFTVTFA